MNMGEEACSLFKYLSVRSTGRDEAVVREGPKNSDSPIAHRLTLPHAAREVGVLKRHGAGEGEK
jgi:hypothetical protein